MKTKVMLVMGVLIFYGLQWSGTQAATAAPAAETPIGRLVDVSLVAWPLTTAVAGTVKGTLIAMPPGWLVIKEGSYEHWVPVEKVMSMRVSR